MARLESREFKIESGLDVSLEQGQLKVSGPKGELTLKLPSSLKLQLEKDKVILAIGEERRNIFGLYGALIQDLIQGVTVGFRKELELVGVGFKVKKEGTDLILNLGFSHPVKFPIPVGVTVEVKDETHLSVSGASRQQVGQVTALLRGLKKPEPYKGKGIKYLGEVIRRKAGKAAKAGLATAK